MPNFTLNKVKIYLNYYKDSKIAETALVKNYVLCYKWDLLELVVWLEAQKRN
jgi:hypothetical protein